jgi:carbon-monoxide dehydrogenase small subunit
VQRAFVAAGAVQCGFCTPGFLMAVRDLQLRVRGRTIINLDDEEVREALAGNLCRCTGYEKVIDAVRSALADLTVPQPPVGASG